MGFHIIFTTLILCIIAVFTKGNIKRILIAIFPTITISLLLGIFVTGYFYCMKPNIIMEEKTIYVNKESYIPHHFLLNEDTISYIEDVEGNTYSFSYKYTPIYEAEESYLIISSQKRIAKMFLYSIPSSYKLYLEKDV